MVVLLRIVYVQITEELKYSLKIQEGIYWLIKWETPGCWTTFRHELSLC